MSAPPTRTARAQAAAAVASAAVLLTLAAAFALGERSDGIAATAATALLLVACVGEVIRHRNRLGGRDA